MLLTTIQDLIQGKLDQQIEGHKLYLVSEKDEPGRQHINQRVLTSLYGETPLEKLGQQFNHPLLSQLNLDVAILDEIVFYIGQTHRNPKERLYEHLFATRQPEQSNLGTLIIQNLPLSLNWTIRLLTLRDCESLVLKMKRVSVVRSIFLEDEINDKMIQEFIDMLPQLYPESPSEVQHIKDHFIELSVGSSSQKEHLVTEATEILRSMDKTWLMEDFPIEKSLRNIMIPDI